MPDKHSEETLKAMALNFFRGDRDILDAVAFAERCYHLGRTAEREALDQAHLDPEQIALGEAAARQFGLRCFERGRYVAHKAHVDRMRGVVDTLVAGQAGEFLEPGSLVEVERRAILQALADCAGSRVAAAKRLGIGKTTLYRKLAEYGVAEAPRCRQLDHEAKGSPEVSA